MKRLALALFAFFAFAASAGAQSSVVTTGGITVEACAVPIVTASAYTANNVIGGLITLSPTFRPTQTSTPDSGGIVQSVRLTFKSTQTATFKAYQFVSNPSGSTWTDKAAPAIVAADTLKVRPPLTFSTADSGLGTHTVYGQDSIARGHVAAGTTDYWVLTTTGTPTPTSTTDMQFCVTYLVD